MDKNKEKEYYQCEISKDDNLDIVCYKKNAPDDIDEKDEIVIEEDK